MKIDWKQKLTSRKFWAARLKNETKEGGGENE